MIASRPLFRLLCTQGGKLAHALRGLLITQLFVQGTLLSSCNPKT